MYKVFFQDRVIYLTKDFSTHFFNNYGLFYKFYDLNELSDLLKLFTVITKIKKLYIFHHNLDQLFTEFKQVFSFIDAAGGLIYNSEGKILVIKRKGKWDLPKGRVEEGESTEIAAAREATEETGISRLNVKSHIIDTYHVYLEDMTPVLKKTHWFMMEALSDEQPTPQLDEEISEAVWYDQEDLPMILGNTYLSIIDVLKKQNLLPF
ncbi:MAG: NUDIX domain-containing protein [Bacteroidales bacterium]|nr:NUDIX domain-containing protein [Bacteroidales bacterium]